MTDDKFAVTVTPDKCPECGFVFECCFGALGDPMASPVPGDWTVCAGCSALLRFKPDLRVRSTTIAERSGPDAPEDLMLAVEALSTIGPNKSEPTTLDNAYLLIASATEALANGVVHRDRSGKVLTTPKEIIECLLREKSVECEETKC